MCSSRIPTISFQSDVSNNKRLKISGEMIMTQPMLKDVTNKFNNNNSIRYSDKSSIELAKSKERKILRDINHFKNSILEIEKDITLYRDSKIPNLSELLLDQDTNLNELQEDLSHLENDINFTALEIEKLIKNHEFNNINLQLLHSIEISSFENQLMDGVYTKKRDMENQLIEIDELKPDASLQCEMNEFQDSVKQLSKDIQSINNSNSVKCNEFEQTELVANFESFKSEKSKRLDRLLSEQRVLCDQLDQLRDENLVKTNLISELQSKMFDLTKNSETLTLTIEELDNLIIPKLQNEFNAKQIKFDKEKSQKNQIDMEAQSTKIEINKQRSKLYCEKSTTRNLQFQINELTNNITLIGITNAIEDKRFHIVVDPQTNLIDEEILPFIKSCKLNNHKTITILHYNSIEYLKQLLENPTDTSPYSVTYSLSHDDDFKINTIEIKNITDFTAKLADQRSSHYELIQNSKTISIFNIQDGHDQINVLLDQLRSMDARPQRK
ncbi:hypothetical protein KAFR_0J02360 [Kazachstania africana CBS 2517]|uniref:Spindle pole body-associated protein Vik1/Cik1 microtubule binding domain-containing protein n=1 Tax=Kazachstania africana (strain ATCC 22294 / BCRC 22015 / CBS 2517 / CECT 1963 / NBRC 1671 / NRRL Y-8276) TaxID=1071382 RepID=H2B100_KAZAF|nr:hypothetical protein KAFR_0J02360 [Kazachstania africana CBS 2517]CCF60300.1 hypothetical protein KAFR_0J02360 [Kazachstania africana CBS 2517]